MIVKTNFTNGVGNNLFQFFFGEILSEKYQLIHHHPALDILSIPSTLDPLDSLRIYKTKILENVDDFLPYLNLPKQTNIFTKTYPEDYRLYLDHIAYWKKKYPPKPPKPDSHICLHLRLGDRLLRKSDYEEGMKLDLKKLDKLLGQLNYDRFEVYCDMHIWQPLEIDDLIKMSFHVDVEKSEQQSPEKIVNHFNQIYSYLNSKNAIIHTGRSVVDDFDALNLYP